MITAYKVSYFEEVNQERYTFPMPHLFLEQAESHVVYLRKAGAADPNLAPVQIEAMAAQKITVLGDVAGYQFSATRMGKRTVQRRVYNIGSDGNGGLLGLANWKGRVLKVALEDWIFDWVAVERIGWIND